MAFEYNPLILKRVYYEASATVVVQVPKGNLYTVMDLMLQAQVNILTSVASNAPDFQIARMIQKIEITRNQTSVWSISGEGLAAYFTNHKGVSAVGNTTIAGTVANNVQAQHFIRCPFAPEDALKPWDLLMDTRGNDYEIAITFRDLTAVGTLFGSIGSSITVANDENYIDITMHKVTPQLGPNGEVDALQKAKPFMRGIRETTHDITSTNSDFSIDLGKFKTYRKLSLWTTHEANSNQTIGDGGVLTDKIELSDTQNHTYGNVYARDVRENTSLNWGVSSLNAGFYEMPLTAFGALVDDLESDSANELKLNMAVSKLTNATAIRIIADTREKQ